MKQPHDTQIGRLVLTRNLDFVNATNADTDYDWNDLRTKVWGRILEQLSNISSYVNMIKWHNAWMDDENYRLR